MNHLIDLTVYAFQLLQDVAVVPPLLGCAQVPMTSNAALLILARLHTVDSIGI